MPQNWAEYNLALLVGTGGRMVATHDEETNTVITRHYYPGDEGYAEEPKSTNQNVLRYGKR